MRETERAQSQATGDQLPRRAHLGMELSLRRGVLVVVHIEAGGPAAQAGVRLDDHLLAVDESPVRDLLQVRRTVGHLPIGQLRKLELVREGRGLSLAVQATTTPVEMLEHGTIELGQVLWQGNRLRTIWSWPVARGPHPVIWLLPGASWLSEEHPTAPWYPTRKLVELLTSAGFATLRIERSGIGDSEGPPCTELDLQQELDAFRTGFAHIEQEPRARRDRLFVFGRSLGGMLTALLLPGRKVAGVAVWGTSSQRWHDALLRSTLRQYALSGLGPVQLATLRRRLSSLQSMVYTDGLTPEEAYSRRPDLRDVLPTVYAGRHVYSRVASYFQQLQREDVRNCFTSIDAPVLAVHGSCDWMSELRDLQAIAQLAQRGRWLEIDGLDHLMHRREGLKQAFAEPWGGTFSSAAGRELVAFFRRIRT